MGIIRSMKKRAIHILISAAALGFGLAGCSTPKVTPQEKVAFERVKSWRSTLDLSSLERRYDLPKGLLSAVMHQESAGKIRARSPVGARGLFQIMPATARDLRLSDPHDPEPAAQAAARYLSTLYKRYDGDLNLSLAAYNWGMGNVDRYKRQGYRGALHPERKERALRVLRRNDRRGHHCAGLVHPGSELLRKPDGTE